MARTVADLTWDDLDSAARHAWSDAANRTLDVGIPVVGSRNGRRIRVHPDGRVEDLGTVSSAAASAPGVALRANLETAQLYEHALRRGEAVLSAVGALCADTGEFTGRSPKDKFTVRDPATEKTVWWAGNQSITSAQFETLHQDFLTHSKYMTLFAQDLYAGADPLSRIKTRVVTELAWHSLFIRTLLIRPERAELASFVPEWTVIDLPSFRADRKRHGVRSSTVVAIDFTRKTVLIGGTHYAGEMKKALFTVLNYNLPSKGVLPMHCAANVGREGDPAIFFGLSGTGKTTLSADPDRTLVGDDEHGWSSQGIFNFEGGCYAKCIKLSQEAEPEIYAASQRFGAVLENVALDEQTREAKFDDGSKTENTRAAYPLDFIPNASRTGRAAHPKNLVMLSADAFGVLPPIAKLSPAQAMYHFLSGYTARVAGTVRGTSNEPQPEFSTCFGSPFLPLDPSVYGNLLRDFISRHSVDCWLVNTGWTGGKFGTGSRMPIKVTRALLSAALDGSLRNVEFRADKYFGFLVPIAVPGVPADILDPVATWPDKKEFDKTARALVGMFQRNFAKFEAQVAVDAEIRAEMRAVAPRIRRVA